MKILRRLCSSMLLLGALTSYSQALPEGASVRAGTVNINTNGNTQTIQQLTDRAIINWNGFNIDVGELVHFVQPSSISAILNRVVGQDPSMILGAMRANGQVFLINPNGVVFGQTATVDVGSLVVSTLNITDQDFLDGRLIFEQEADKELAAVINHGTIRIDDNGFVVLTGPMVANDGVILARVGQVAMAAGTRTTVSFDPTGMIQLELPADSSTADGLVSLSHEDAGDLLASVVSTPNTQAGQIVVRDGRTFLEVESGTLVNAGEIRADGQAGQDGGRIVLDSTANTILAESSITAAAGSGLDSSGGEIFVLSDGASVSEYGSRIDVSGGTSGDGGFVEQSGQTGFVGAQVMALALDGEVGTFLVDPDRIVVETGAGQGGDPMMFFPEDTLEAALANIVLVADSGVDFQALNGDGLELRDGINLTIDISGGTGLVTTFADPTDKIILKGSGSFQLSSDTGGDAQSLKVVTESGNIAIDLGGGSLDNNSSFTTDDGTVTANVLGELVLISGNASSADSLKLGDISADTVTGTGDDFTVDGVVSADDISLTATGSIERTNDFSHQLQASNTLKLSAPDIGRDRVVYIDGDALEVTGEYINLDTFGFLSSVTATNLDAVDPFVRITVGGGDASYLLDSGSTVAGDVGDYDLSYTFTGDRTLDAINTGSGTATFTTSGSASNDIDGNVRSAGDLNITADDIRIAVGTFEDSGIQGTFTGTATNGSIFVHDQNGNPLDVDLTATDEIRVNFLGEGSTSSVATGSADAPTVLLSGGGIGNLQDAFQLGPNVVEAILVWEDGDAFVQADSPSIDLYADGYFGETESLFFNNSGGDIVVGAGEGFVYASVSTSLTASGSITTFDPFSTIEAGQALSLTANTINANVEAPEVVANATGDVTLTTQFTLDTLYSGASTGGSFIINHETERISEGQFEDLPIASTGQIQAAGTLTIDVADGALNRQSGQLVAPNVNLSAVNGEGGEGPAIEADLRTTNLIANAVDNIDITGDSANLNVTSNTTGPGSFTRISNAGNTNLVDVSTFTLLVDDRESGGNVTSTNPINAFITDILAENVDITTDSGVINVEASGDAIVEATAAQQQQIDILAGNTASFTTPGGTAALQTFEGTNLILDVGTDFNDSLTADGFVQVTAESVNLDVTAQSVTATARTGDVTLTGSNANIGVSAFSQNGDVSVTNDGNITQNAMSGDAVRVTASGGNINPGNGRVAGTSVILAGNNVDARTATGNLSVNVAGSGNATIDNDSASLTTSISTTGDVSVANTGTLAGTFEADNLKLAGQSVDADIAANTVEGDATGGNVALASTGTNELTVTNSSAPNGEFSLTHNGDVVFDRIEARSVNIDTSGDITDIANTIVASGITLNGNNVFVNTQGQIIVITAQGNVSVANTLVDVSSLTIDAQGNVSFGTDGNLNIAQVAGGQLVSLTAGGNITAGSGSFVNGFDIELFAGGSITPDLNNPLTLGATNSILVQAQGGSVAAALQGGLSADAVTIQTPAGPIYYNGVLLNGEAAVITPPTVDITEVENQIGQQNGQVVDDGSVGSAANDGLVQESPTQKLVSQLTEAAGGSNGATTKVLITLEIDQLGEVEVELSQPSPFDQTIDSDQNLTADDVLDLDTEELTEIEVSLYYDPANDQLIMAVNLSADDVLDLDVSDYELIPVNVNYQITGDPALMIEALRANDIIDLRVEELGEIPIKVHVSGDGVSDND